MDDTVLMCDPKTGENLREDPSNGVEFHGARLHDFFQFFAGNVLQRQKRRAVVFSELENRDHIGVNQASRCLRLSLEAFHILTGLDEQQFAPNGLDGNVPSDRRIEALKDHPHSPLAEDAVNNVPAYFRGWPVLPSTMMVSSFLVLGPIRVTCRHHQYFHLSRLTAFYWRHENLARISP